MVAVSYHWTLPLDERVIRGGNDHLSSDHNFCALINYKNGKLYGKDMIFISTSTSERDHGGMHWEQEDYL